MCAASSSTATAICQAISANSWRAAFLCNRGFLARIFHRAILDPDVIDGVLDGVEAGAVGKHPAGEDAADIGFGQRAGRRGDAGHGDGVALAGRDVGDGHVLRQGGHGGG